MDKKDISFANIIIEEAIKHIAPDSATVVNLGVSFLHRSETEKTEKPIDEVIPKTTEDTEIILSLSEEHRHLPLLVTGVYGKGRTVCWTSDMSEHWLPPAFLAWDGYDKLFGNMVAWASGKS